MLLYIDDGSVVGRMIVMVLHLVRYVLNALLDHADVKLV